PARRPPRDGEPAHDGRRRDRFPCQRDGRRSLTDVFALRGGAAGVTPPHRARSEPMTPNDDLTSQRFYHGTKADLKPGDLIAPGKNSNYGKRKQAAYVYLAATLDAATWGAELAIGEGRGRIYVVEPTGPIEDDPNLT